MAKNSKKQIQTKNGFPILVEKKPKPKKPNSDDGKIHIDPLKVYEIIGKSVSNYRLDKVTKEMAESVGKGKHQVDMDMNCSMYSNVKMQEVDKGKHQVVYDDDRNSSMYIAHAIQLEQAVKNETLIVPNETPLFDPNMAGKITDHAKRYLKDKVIPKYERASKAKHIDGKTQSSPGIKLPHYDFGMRIKDNSTYGLFARIPTIQNDDLIRVIKSRKDFDDLFGPLKKVKVQIFREQIAKAFPDYDVSKVGSKIIATLKNYAYLKSMKGTDRKFIPDGDELALIIDASYIYDIAKFKEQDPHTILNMLHAGVIRNTRNVSKSEIGKLIEQVEDLLNSIEYQSLDSGVMDEFQHYDIKIKFLRLLTEPKLDTLIENIFKEFDTKSKFDYIEGKSDYEIGMFYINMVKKLGLRYISSRSNIEWLFYGSTLKKIRNFMSKDMYRAFVKVIIQNLAAYKQKEWDNFEFGKDSNLLHMERSLKVIENLREKKFKQNKTK